MIGNYPDILSEGYNFIEGGQGFIFSKLPQEIRFEVRNIVDELQNNFLKATPANSRLEGHINKEYFTNLPSKSTQYIKHIVEIYNYENPQYLKHYTQLNPPTLSYNGDCWVNFQEKHEYNPIHDHSGALSFVIWHQIPYYKENEIKYGPGSRDRTKDQDTKINHNGEFEFITYNNGKIGGAALGIDKTKEGYMALFPSDLAHVVYPFYSSDDYRITISGNIHLK